MEIQAKHDPFQETLYINNLPAKKAAYPCISSEPFFSFQLVLFAHIILLEIGNIQPECINPYINTNPHPRFFWLKLMFAR